MAVLGNPLGTPSLVLSKTLLGVETKNLFDAPCPYPIRILRCWGVMLTAGTSGDTCVLQRVAGGTTASITDSADLSIYSDTDAFEFSQYNDLYWSIGSGDTLQAVTAGGSTTANTVQLYVEYVRTES